MWRARWQIKGLAQITTLTISSLLPTSVRLDTSYWLLNGNRTVLLAEHSYSTYEGYIPS